VIILAIDTSGPVAGVALMQDGLIRYEAAAVNQHTHSASIMPMVEEAFLRTDITAGDVTLFAAVKGPGSFTGVRIGVSLTKAMAHALGTPCIGIDSLEALAAGVLFYTGIICPIRDARVNQVYGAAFTSGNAPVRLMEDRVLKLPEYLAAVSALGREMLFTGDGAEAYREPILNIMGERACFAPPHLACLRPASVAWLARLKSAEASDYLSLMPLYLRAPQAERERAQKETHA
jgi:tRNA threonylcarbamoyladenosine biosynthesis protein TsaB